MDVSRRLPLLDPLDSVIDKHGRGDAHGRIPTVRVRIDLNGSEGIVSFSKELKRLGITRSQKTASKSPKKKEKVALREDVSDGELTGESSEGDGGLLGRDVIARIQARHVNNAEGSDSCGEGEGARKGTKSKEDGKGKKRRRKDQVLDDWYDLNDPFIDDEDAYDERLGSKGKPKEDGFFVFRGRVELDGANSDSRAAEDANGRSDVGSDDDFASSRPVARKDGGGAGGAGSPRGVKGKGSRKKATAGREGKGGDPLSVGGVVGRGGIVKKRGGQKTNKEHHKKSANEGEGGEKKKKRKKAAAVAAAVAAVAASSTAEALAGTVAASGNAGALQAVSGDSRKKPVEGDGTKKRKRRADADKDGGGEVKRRRSKKARADALGAAAESANGEAVDTVKKPVQWVFAEVVHGNKGGSVSDSRSELGATSEREREQQLSGASATTANGAGSGPVSAGGRSFDGKDLIWEDSQMDSQMDFAGVGIGGPRVDLHEKVEASLHGFDLIVNQDCRGRSMSHEAQSALLDTAKHCLPFLTTPEMEGEFYERLASIMSQRRKNVRNRVRILLQRDSAMEIGSQVTIAMTSLKSLVRELADDVATASPDKWPQEVIGVLGKVVSLQTERCRIEKSGDSNGAVTVADAVLEFVEKVVVPVFSKADITAAALLAAVDSTIVPSKKADQRPTTTKTVTSSGELTKPANAAKSGDLAPVHPQPPPRVNPMPSQDSRASAHLSSASSASVQRQSSESGVAAGPCAHKWEKSNGNRLCRRCGKSPQEVANDNATPPPRIVAGVGRDAADGVGASAASVRREGGADVYLSSA